MHGAAAEARSSDLVLGRYRPLRPLGTGGSGSVWLARDERSGLDVALKIVPREGKAGTRAEREAKAAAKLRHPRCLRAYSLGRDPSHVYIAYEYVPGLTLREAMRARSLTDGDTVEAAAQILEGLAHAHERGIVHRDVKPANVLLAQPAERERRDAVDARLLDFGLALMQDEQTLTARGDIPGTLAYISPERLSGEPARPAADVWAVGVILWEALAGRHPFWDGSPLSVQRAILAGAPSLREHRPDLPKALHEAVASALVLNPSERPTAGELAERLRNLGRRHGRRLPPSTPRAPSRPRALAVRSRLAPAALSALAAGWTAAAMPFYPAHFPAGLAAVAALLTLSSERAGVAFALGVPFFPLANLSLGLALAYAAIAAAWLALAWRDARAGLLFAVGPVLAPLAAVALLPLAAQATRGALRRAATVVAGVLLAAVVAGLRHAPLPFGLGAAPGDLRLAGSDRPITVLGVLWRTLAAHPALLVEALVLAAVAVALPHVRGRGPWPVACFGAAMLAATVLPAPGVAPLPLVAAAWATCAALVWDALRAPVGGR